METTKTLADYGIKADPGQIRAFCPQCSPGRKKSYEKCLSVDQERGLWFCHHCGWSGGVKGTGEEAESAQALKLPHFVRTEIEDEKVLSWFAERGICKATLAEFHVSSGEAWMHGPNGGGKVNAIQFPFYFGGQVVNVKYRTGDKRFRQEKNARKCFFNHDKAFESTSDFLVITEGEMDCLALWECGYRGVVSVPDGAPPEDAQNYTTKFDFLHGAEPLLEKFRFVILAVDGDAPGKKLEEELLRRIGADKCKRVLWPDGCKDANDVFIQHGRDALRRCIDEAKFFPVSGVLSVSDLWTDVFDLHDKPKQPGVSIGWDNAYSLFNVEPGQITIVTGIPSHGKSTFIDALRVNLFRFHGWPSAAFSAENWPAESHLSILAEMYSGENFKSMTPDSLYGVMTKISHAFYFIQPDKDDVMMTVDAILTSTRSLVLRNGIKILVMDPWNEIEHATPPGQREDQYISIQLAKIRRFARVFGIHIFLIAHPRQLEKNKDGEYPPPTAYDIAGGAMWRNKADNILCVYRPDMKTGETHVYIQKVRFRRNGRAGEVIKFLFNADISTYLPTKELSVQEHSGIEIQPHWADK